MEHLLTAIRADTLEVEDELECCPPRLRPRTSDLSPIPVDSDVTLLPQAQDEHFVEVPRGGLVVVAMMLASGVITLSVIAWVGYYCRH